MPRQVVFVVLGALGGAALTGIGVLVAASLPRPNVAFPLPGVRVSASPSLSAFVGNWSRHDAVLVIRRTGDFAVQWRTYRWCSDSPPPCDTTTGDVINDGGHASGRVEPATDRIARGEIATTNNDEFLSKGPILLTLADYQILTMHSSVATLTFCGRGFSESAPPDLVAAHPCGA
jgi:hypothetical protein